MHKQNQHMDHAMFVSSLVNLFSVDIAAKGYAPLSGNNEITGAWTPEAPIV